MHDTKQILAIAAVSYTHLDVYKRQQFMFVKPKAELTGIRFCLKKI